MVGRFNVTGALRYVGIVRPLSCTSCTGKLSGQVGYCWYSSFTSTNSTLEPFSKLWCKQTKLDLLKKGFPARFENMSKLKHKDYFAITSTNRNNPTLGEKAAVTPPPFSWYSLEKMAGIYMITNKVTKKFYIGMSSDLKGRFYNYLNINRLNLNNSTRIHKALLKYGFENFSITILEFVNSRNTKLLREREDFFIKVFRPQYNIKRSQFNTDIELSHNFAIKKARIIPTKVKSLLEKCLDPALLEWHLIDFRFNKRRGFYFFKAITPIHIISANSLGWFEGNITKQIGYDPVRKPEHKIFSDYMFYKSAYKLIDREILANFFTDKGDAYVKDSLANKLKALKSYLK